MVAKSKRLRRRLLHRQRRLPLPHRLNPLLPRPRLPHLHLCRLLHRQRPPLPRPRRLLRGRLRRLRTTTRMTTTRRRPWRYEARAILARLPTPSAPTITGLRQAGLNTIDRS